MVNQSLMTIEYKNPPKPRLINAQEDLLSLFLNGQPINYEYVRQIWVNFYANKIIDGQPYRWVNEWEKNNTESKSITIGNFIKMKDGEVRNRVFCWLKGCIGALVFKGYLKVIPNFNFEVK